MKEYGKAIDDLSKAIELDPNNALTYTMRGAVYVIKKEYQKGVDDFTKAISLRPEETQVYITRAWRTGNSRSTAGPSMTSRKRLS